jgi:hypothetical protein
MAFISVRNVLTNKVVWNIDSTAAKYYRDYEMNDAIYLYEKAIQEHKIQAINKRYLSK